MAIALPWLLVAAAEAIVAAAEATALVLSAALTAKVVSDEIDEYRKQTAQMSQTKADSTEECPEDAAEGEAEKGKEGEKGKRFTPEQSDIIKQAKEGKKTGLNEQQAKDLVQKAKDAGLPARGPEVHPNRPFGKEPHIHVGPINHIPVR